MGSVVISLDAELGWGFHDLPALPAERVARARWGWKQTLELLDAYEIPATWAVVGHLMLGECDGRHENHPTPPGWFERERTDWADRPDLRFGTGLVSAILDSPIGHEIGSHSFSHVLFDDADTTADIARAECERAIEIAEEWGLSLRSFVFPRNEVGHRDVLADTGFSTYRSRADDPEGAHAVVRDVLRPTSLLVTPSIDEFGLVDVPPSLFAFGFEGSLRRIGETLCDDPMVALAHRGIDQAVAGDGVFHLWFHPNNVTTDRDAQRMRRIFAYLARRRDETSLQVETMGQIGRRTVAVSEADAGPGITSNTPHG